MQITQLIRTIGCRDRRKGNAERNYYSRSKKKRDDARRQKCLVEIARNTGG